MREHPATYLHHRTFAAAQDRVGSMLDDGARLAELPPYTAGERLTMTFEELARIESARMRKNTTAHTAETARHYHEKARAAGKQIGRPPTTQKRVLAALRKAGSGPLSTAQIAKVLNITHNAALGALYGLEHKGEVTSYLENTASTVAKFWMIKKGDPCPTPTY